MRPPIEKYIKELNSMSSGKESNTMIRTMFAKKPLMANPSMMPPICVEGIIPPSEKVEFYASPELTPTIVNSPTPTQKAISGSNLSVMKGKGTMKIAHKKLVTLILKL